MARVKRGVIARARHKKILKQAKGYYGARSRVYRVAFQAVIKAGQYAYRDHHNVSVKFVNCGLRVSTQQHVRTVFLTANSSMA